MASNYPGSLDSFDTIASDKKTSDAVGGRTHRQMHNDLGDAIEAVQTELGTTPSGSYATVKARFEAIEGSTLPQIDAKGDLIVGTADNTYDNLSVGTNGQLLVADSAQSKGMKWAGGIPSSTTDNTVARYDGTAGALQGSGVTIDDNNRVGFATGATGGYRFGASGTIHLEGTGVPESVVSAGPGSTFMQTDAVTEYGFLLWIKAWSTSSTGWVPSADADTGWRNVTASLINGWAMGGGGKLILRRKGDTVTLQAGYRLDGTSASAAGIYALPSGFQMLAKTSTRMVGVATSSSSGSGWPTTPLKPVYHGTTAANTVEMESPGQVAIEFTLRFTTADTWPTSLPGSAA